MQPFAIARPASVEAAARILEAQGDGAWLLAGGQTLIPSLKQGLLRPDVLVSLSRCAGLEGIEEREGRLRVGAMTTHRAVARDGLVRRAAAGLAQLAGGIGDPAVRSRGTIGGSVANADPAADYPAALLALDAWVETDRRRIPAADFFRGLFETALAPGEIITAVSFAPARRSVYLKFRNPASGYAVVGLFLAELDQGGVRVALTGAAPKPLRWREAEEAVAAAGWRPARLNAPRLDAGGLNSDLHADAAYRAHLASVMLRRAVEALS